jgi:hypothetical protein
LKLRVLVQPVGLGLLGLSLAVAVAPEFGASWSGREVWIVLWGFAAYATVVGVSNFSDRESSTRQPNVVTPEVAPPDFEAWTTEALRQMRSSEALARCSLIAAIPKTLAAARNDADKASPVTPLEQAQLLYSILHASIERLKLAADAASPGDPEGLHYVILHDEYVLGRPNVYIMTHHSLAEATFHRYRRQAIHALASELAAQEQLLA